ncbi:MAG: collagen-like protein [Chitinophagaceae bacterium]
MRKFNSLPLLLLAFTFIAASCTKEGPEGPVGATGAQGPPGTTGATGAPGAPGAGQTIYSAWATTVAADWVIGYAAPNNYNVELVANRTAPGVTQAILDNGIVLCYAKNITIGASTVMPNVVQLPWIEQFNDQSYGFVLDVGKVVFTYDIGNTAPGPRPVSQLTPIAYRYVIIAGSISGGRGVNGQTTYEGLTAEELKAMSYEEVASRFNIPENGTNIQ